jgi:SAM-dependent methyltransferase
MDQSAMLSKTYFIEKLIEESGVSHPRILELGCGTARHVAPILKERSDITYVGIEPYAPSFKKAEDSLSGLAHATLFHQLGYEPIASLEDGSFDIVFSLSVLEHVKQLEAFIMLGARYAKSGGLVVHRYDLGHALNSRSVKERFQVWIGNTFPKILPEDKYVCYVDEDFVRTLLKKSLCDPYRTTAHEMSGQKPLNKLAMENIRARETMESLLEWEYTHAQTFLLLPRKVREHLFPAVAVWSRKK